jgi:hypothetical protein
MDTPLNVTFTSVPQYSLSLDSATSLGLVSLTSPTLPGDRYWYDEGTPITLVLRGIYGRSGAEGVRLAGFTLNGWNATSTAEAGNVTVLAGHPMDSPLAVASQLATDFKVVVSPGPPSSGTVSLLTPPSLPGDAGWYDAGTVVTLDATPNTGFDFQGWGGSVVVTSGPQEPYLSLVVSQPIAETAVFGAVPTVHTTTTSHEGGQPSLGIGTLPVLAAGILMAVSAYALYSYRNKQGETATDEPSHVSLLRRRGRPR